MTNSSDALPADFLLSVVMPVYNEQKTLRDIVAAVRAVPIRKELILVDDGSKDDSRKILAELAAQFPEVRVFEHPQNRGKGAALRTGFEQAKGDIVVVQDADLVRPRRLSGAARADPAR